MIIGILGSLIPTAIIFAGYEGIINWMNDKFHVVTVFMKFCTDPADYVILTSVSIVGRNRDRIAWKFYHDP